MNGEIRCCEMDAADYCRKCGTSAEWWSRFGAVADEQFINSMDPPWVFYCWASTPEERQAASTAALNKRLGVSS